MRCRLLVYLVCIVGVHCAGPGEAAVETMGDNVQRLPYRMESLTGVRDGDVLRTRLAFTGDESPLVVEMVFRIGVPTRLEAGSYRWKREGQEIQGAVREVSVTFLGGQSDRPSLGGIFVLLSDGGAPVYRIHLPTTTVSRSSPAYR